MMQTIGSLIQTIKGAVNPQAMIEQTAKTDPRMGKVMDIVQQNGGDARTAFYNTARQMGVDPETILQQIRGL